MKRIDIYEGDISKLIKKKKPEELLEVLIRGIKNPVHPEWGIICFI